MLNRELNEKNIVRREECVIERWDRVMTKFEYGDVERIWMLPNIKIEGEGNKKTVVSELLGYRVVLGRKISGDICLNVVDAITSAELRYEKMLNKIADKIGE